MPIQLPPEEKPDEPNMTPFIDITFQLLIFFMLTIRFKTVEGRLLSHLPKDMGLMSSPSPQPPEEIRIVMCLNDDWQRHTADKGSHDVRERFSDITQVHLYVQRNKVGVATLGPEGQVTQEGNAYYDEVARQANELRRTLPGTSDGQPAPIKIDADSEVAVQHVIGILNALYRLGARENVQFTGNPRLNRYFGQNPGGAPAGGGGN